ncbi:MAG: hypothetical protein J1F41_03485 [Lachnospiraceae bacterium]|nr:hypothetical protein [Lachnospiraceae bacterium]
MLEIIICLGLLTVIFWFCFKITGVMFSILFWLCIKLPCAILMAFLGIVFCITILLMPIGKDCFNLARKVLI